MEHKTGKELEDVMVKKMKEMFSENEFFTLGDAHAGISKLARPIPKDVIIIDMGNGMSTEDIKELGKDHTVVIVESYRNFADMSKEIIKEIIGETLEESVVCEQEYTCSQLSSKKLKKLWNEAKKHKKHPEQIKALQEAYQEKLAEERRSND